MYVSVDIDPDDILDDMGLDDIVEYLKKHFSVKAILHELNEVPTMEFNEKKLADRYWHGDLNIKSLLKKLGPEETKKIFQEI